MKQTPKGIPEENILDLRSEKKTASASVPKKKSLEYEEQPKTSSKKNASVSFLRPNDSQKYQAADVAKHNVKEKEQPTHKAKKIRFNIRKRVSPLTLGFFVLFILIIAGVFGSVHIYSQATEAKGRVLGASTNAFHLLEDAEGALLANDRTSVRESLENAEGEFESALDEVQRVYDSYGLLLSLSGTKSQLEAGENALKVGRSVARMGVLLDTFISDAEQDGAVGYVGFMEAYQTYGAPIRFELNNVDSYLSAVDVDKLPSDYRDMLESAKSKFERIASAFLRADTMLSVFSDTLGFNGERSHLLVFQNNQELRATGGFIGSVARIKVVNGTISSLTVPKGGSYDISGQVSAHYKAPRPLQIVNEYFSFQDANWFANFEDSARKILELYYDAGNKEVDGIIAFTPDVIIHLLEITGPIELEDTVSVSVTKENFLRVIRDAIEDEKETQSNEPKKVIAELMPKLLNAALTLPMEDQLSIAFLLDDALQNKDILIYASDSDLEQEIQDAGFSGNLTDPAQYNDYLSLNSSNIAGGKTDRDIEQHLTVVTDLTKSNVQDTVTIIRTHNGIVSDRYSGTTNLSYVRFYTPLGSTFLSAQDFYDVPDSWYQEPPSTAPTDPDLAKEELDTIIQEATGTRIVDNTLWTVFGNWIRVEPANSERVSISYELPYTRTAEDPSWSMFFEKQPGGHTTYVTWEIITDEDVKGFDISLPSAHEEKTADGARFSFELTEDVLAGVIFD